MWKMYLLIAVGVALIIIGAVSYQQNHQIDEYKPLTSPLIGMTDVLNNPEFKEGIQQAVRENDEALMADLQDKAIEIAQVAGFNDSQMKLLEGEQGKNYLSFNAKRQLFMQAFSLAYKQLDDIEPLKKRYPEARDLFAKADELIAKREADLIAAAKELAGSESDYQGYLEQAREQWRQAAHDSELETTRVSK